MRRRQPFDPFAPHHDLRFIDLVAAIFQRRVFAAGPALIADLGQTLRIDRQAEDLRLEIVQRRRQLAAFEIVRNQRVIGRLQPILHRQVQAGRRLAAARHAHQDHVGLGQILVRLAVVVGQREIDRLDAVLVRLGIRILVKASDRMGRFQPQFLFERLDKGLEHVQDHALGAAQRLVRLGIDQRGEDDRRDPFGIEGLVDLADRHMRLFRRIDKGHSHLAKAHLELGQDRMTEGFGGDPGAVRDDKYGADGRLVGARRGGGIHV